MPIIYKWHYINKSGLTIFTRDRCHPLRDNAYLLHFRIGLGYGFNKFPY